MHLIAFGSGAAFEADLQAAALTLGGRWETARSLANRGLEMEPGIRCRLFSEWMGPQVADRLAEGGRLLGLPD